MSITMHTYVTVGDGMANIIVRGLVQYKVISMAVQAADYLYATNSQCF